MKHFATTAIFVAIVVAVIWRVAAIRKIVVGA